MSQDDLDGLDSLKIAAELAMEGEVEFALGNDDLGRYFYAHAAHSLEGALERIRSQQTPNSAHLRALMMSNIVAYWVRACEFAHACDAADRYLALGGAAELVRLQLQHFRELAVELAAGSPCR